MITLRGHHLCNLYDYLKAKGNPELTSRRDEFLFYILGIKGYPKKHISRAIGIVKKALNPKESIRLIDSLDDICITCKDKTTKECKEFISLNDKEIVGFYGFKIGRKYSAKYIHMRIREKGRY